MEITHERIFDFKDHEYVPAHHDPKEPGYYMTIRCGLSGIYTNLDEWINSCYVEYNGLTSEMKNTI